MKKTLLTVSIALLILAASIAVGWTIKYSDHPTENPTTSQPATVTTEEQIEAIRYQGEDGKTALELLQSNAEVEMQGSGEMVFVTAIDGVEASDAEFWSFLVNGKMANTGAGSYITDSDDVITWQLQAIEPNPSNAANSEDAE